MKYPILQNILFSLGILMTLFGCKKNDNDNGGGGNGGGGGNSGGGVGMVISGTSPDYLYWGDELTINGSGFSTDKNDYTVRFMNDFPGCNLSAFQVISATTTQLKVKMPIGLTNSGKKCGPSAEQVIIAANGKSDTTGPVKFLGYPRIQGVCTHFGGWAGDYVIPGDSVMLNMSGATGIYASVNNYNKNAILTINGTPIPVQWRNYSGCTNGLGAVITLDKSAYAEFKCPTDGDWNGGGRNLVFKVSNPGTNRSDSINLFVNWIPTWYFSQVTGPSSVSMSAGGFPAWTIKGRNMAYVKARFTSTNCMLTPQEVGISQSNFFYDEGTIQIPLSVLSVGCNYSVSIITNCGNERVLGSLMVSP